ncbi:MAG: DUF1638 domain-containing protein [Candidatus Methanoplasma sp.]|jgi:hypothetical protein|nr:DUF1638 domain-containing protein [Candidatus Methanoplasma sp.]
MRVGIVACDILKGEIEYATRGDPDIAHREYLEFALHVEPELMRERVLERIDALEGAVDSVFLGYGACQSLAGVPSVARVPTAMLAEDDCIGALLGAERYEAEKKACAGTWFSTPGWAEVGAEGLIKELRLDTVEGHDPRDLLDRLFESYGRCLFIDPGIGMEERYCEKSGELAAELGMRLERCSCGLERIREALGRAKDLARKASG